MGVLELGTKGTKQEVNTKKMFLAKERDLMADRATLQWRYLHRQALLGGRAEDTTLRQELRMVKEADQG